MPPRVADPLIMAAQVIAALYRCPSCASWWVGRQGEVQEAHLILQLVEGHRGLFAWEKYHGWQAYRNGEMTCPQCGKQGQRPLFSISQQFGEDGRLCSSP